MRIGVISSEISPLAKTGGLADVVGSLSVALEQLGHKLCLIMPAYRSALQGGFALKNLTLDVSVSLSDRQETASVLQAKIGHDVIVYLVRADRYFDREFLYGTKQGDYTDNLARFVFLTRSALEILRHEQVELIHCHDWQTALAPVFLRTQPLRYPEIASAKTILTVHNIAFQGNFWR